MLPILILLEIFNDYVRISQEVLGWATFYEEKYAIIKIDLGIAMIHLSNTKFCISNM